jgi:hypothetical protein
MVFKQLEIINNDMTDQSFQILGLENSQVFCIQQKEYKRRYRVDRYILYNNNNNNNRIEFTFNSIEIELKKNDLKQKIEVKKDFKANNN